MIKNWFQVKEYETKMIDRSKISNDEGAYLWQNYSRQLNVGFPSPKTDYQCQITPSGWVGFIPINDEIGINISPKVPIGNLFKMLEYAYNIQSFEFGEGLIQSDSLQDFYDRLASLLSKRILARARKGFNKSYHNQNRKLNYIRGRIDSSNLVSKTWEVKFNCLYQLHLADNKENKILLWTLYKIIKSGICSPDTISTVRKAFRSLQSFAQLESYSAKDCLDINYNRLNQDYEILHALSRFFLSERGPTYEAGTNRMFPFLIYIPSLFEMFIAEWLNQKLPDTHDIKSQEKFSIDKDRNIFFKMDIVLYNSFDKSVTCIIDTKYKNAKSPSMSDISQIVTYALSKECDEAILLYPTDQIDEIDQQLNNIRIRSLSFSLDNNLDEEGKEFINKILYNQEVKII